MTEFFVYWFACVANWYIFPEYQQRKASLMPTLILWRI
ncbi:hypothetical protein AWRI1631_74540 [Saccharomyces cerevisiae AWRI1631]|uniref:Uncharacterized protein n=1 Tax=Saccharomyces cerevisiae (strain AWRI1631) TaxID=545124 RepID=B5VJH3_YEAS6|nr:hypothetical protein AWRI1631_74540 [Saccharomyces cerevisiae AWRI1631]